MSTDLHNVFLLLNDNRDLLGDNQPVTDEKRREIYVALTRAKNKLSIHLNSYYPEIFGNEEKIIRFDKAYYPMPERLLFLLTHRDVWLDFFKDARRQGGERVKDRANGVAGNEGFAAACRYLEAEIWNTGYHVLVSP